MRKQGPLFKKNWFIFSFIEKNLSLFIIWIISLLVLTFLSWTSYKSIQLSGFADVKHYTVQFDTSISINKLLVTPGMSVKKGQLIANLNSYEVDSEIAKLNKELLSQTSEYEIQSRTYESQDDLLKKLTQRPESSLSFIERQIKALLQLKQMALKRKNQLQVISPFNGIIGTINSNDNEIVPAFTPILTIHENKASYVKTYIAEGQNIELSLGQTVKVNAINRDVSIEGRVFQIGSVVKLLPKRMQKNGFDLTYGREVHIQLEGNTNLLIWEKVIVTNM